MQGLRTTIYFVTDIEAATKWYEKLFEVKPYFVNACYVGFNIGGYELGLSPQEENYVKKASVISYWGVEDMTTSFEKLKATGAAISEEIVDVGKGILMASIVDPWGNILGIIYNPHFKISN